MINAFFGITIGLVVLICSIVTLTTVSNKAKTAQEYYKKAKEIADANKGGSGGPTEYELMEDARQLIAIIAGKLEWKKNEGTTVVIRPNNEEDAKQLVSQGHLATRTTCWMFIVLSSVYFFYNIYMLFSLLRTPSQKKSYGAIS